MFEKKTIISFAYKLILLIIALVLVSEILLVMVSLIPSTRLEEHIEEGIDVVREREGYINPQVFAYTQGSKLDNYTDRDIFNLVLDPGGETALEKAQVPNYARYWQGYLVFLKPLFVSLNYTQIRYFHMFIFMICLVLIVILLEKRVSSAAAISFAIALCLCYGFVIPYCLEYVYVFFVMFIAMIILLAIPNLNNKTVSWLFFFFWIVGAVTAYVDFLTAPLITLCVPLAIVIIRRETKLLEFCGIAVGWMGYFVHWAMKWFMASIILHTNVLSDAVNSASERLGAQRGEDSISRLEAIRQNIETIMPYGMTYPKYKLMLLLFVFIIIFGFCHKEWSELKKLFLLIMLAASPYCWYFVMANHSYIHHFFTYREQFITVFCLLLFAEKSIDWKKFRNTIKKFILNYRA